MQPLHACLLFLGSTLGSTWAWRLSRFFACSMLGAVSTQHMYHSVSGAKCVHVSMRMCIAAAGSSGDFGARYFQ